jgi:hypothetical protein
MIKDPSDYVLDIPIWPIDSGAFDEMDEWLRTNIHSDKWTYTFGKVCFKDEQDAIIFRLRFGV